MEVIPVARRTAYLAILLVTIFLVSLAAPAVLAQSGPGSGGTSNRPSETPSESPDRDPEGDDDHESSGPGGRSDDHREGPRRPGRLVEHNGSYDGRYVDFEYSPVACQITDYRVYNITFFESIQLPGPCEDNVANFRSHGSSAEFESEGGELRVHDAPNGLLVFHADDNGVFSFQFAAGLTPTQTNRSIEASTGNLTSQLRPLGNGTVTLNGSSASIGDGSFWVHPLRGASPERQAIFDGVKHRKVAGEVDILIENGTVSSEVLTYDDVVVRVSKRSESTYRFLVDANLTEGRTFIVNFAPGAFRAERIGVQYFDLDNTSAATQVAIAEADSLADVLQISAEEGPEYWIVHDAAGTHVLVAVPSFSVHVFELSALSAQVVPIIVYGVLLGVAFVALGVAGLMPRRRA